MAFKAHKEFFDASVFLGVRSAFGKWLAAITKGADYDK